MNSIQSLRLDFNTQIHELGKISNEKLSNNVTFVGSGDSYVAGLIVEFLTDHKCKCYSPSDLFYSRFTKGDTYCFISATGKTNANIKVAKRAKEAQARTIAVTLNKNSELSQICKEIIPLNIARARASTGNFSVFNASVVTCLQLAGIEVPKNFNTWHANAIRQSQSLLESIALPQNAAIYLLGNNLLYALAQYASLKLTEFFGLTSIVDKLEEFCHSPIFGTRKSQHIWIFGQNEVPISQSIKKLGLHISYFELQSLNKIEQSIQSIFFLQNLMLLLAEKCGITEMQYLVEKDKLKTSSELIYND